MKRWFCISVMPILLVLYWFTAVYPVSEIGECESAAIYFPCIPQIDTVYRYETLWYLDYSMNTLLHPIQFCSGSKLKYWHFDFGSDFFEYPRRYPYVEKLDLFLKTLVPVFSIAILAAFCFSLRKTREISLIFIPLGISILYGSYWYFERHDEYGLGLVTACFYIHFGMLWAVVSQGTYWLWEFFATKKRISSITQQGENK